MSYHSPDETTEYLICLAGCDDSTRFLMDLTDQEKECIDRLIALANQASEYSCMPSMWISDDITDITDFLEEQQAKLRAADD